MAEQRNQAGPEQPRRRRVPSLSSDSISPSRVFRRSAIPDKTRQVSPSPTRQQIMNSRLTSWRSEIPRTVLKPVLKARKEVTDRPRAAHGYFSKSSSMQLLLLKCCHRHRDDYDPLNLDDDRGGFWSKVARSFAIRSPWSNPPSPHTCRRHLLWLSEQRGTEPGPGDTDVELLLDDWINFIDVSFSGVNMTSDEIEARRMRLLHIREMSPTPSVRSGRSVVEYPSGAEALIEHVRDASEDGASSSESSSGHRQRPSRKRKREEENEDDDASMRNREQDKMTGAMMSIAAAVAAIASRDHLAASDESDRMMALEMRLNERIDKRIDEEISKWLGKINGDLSSMLQQMRQEIRPQTAKSSL